MAKIKFLHNRHKGSALILAVVITSLLAVIGAIFLMTSRVERVSTSAIQENKELDSAVEAAIFNVSQQLLLDVPKAGQEYYDYPDIYNSWLASLEPRENTSSPSQYYWPQISDIGNYLTDPNNDPNGMGFVVNGILAIVIDDYQRRIKLGDLADADGDGVSDSMWRPLTGITTNKGEDVYAAIRVVDNSAMLNANTAYKFEANSLDRKRVDGSSQTQINLMALARKSWEIYEPNFETQLLEQRVSSSDANEFDLNDYESNFIWKYNGINPGYTPFDISDELELRSRFLLNNEEIITRLENWGEEFINTWTKRVPVISGGIELDEWFERTGDPNTDRYSYRHLVTTQNMDRVIRPDGTKMVDVNTSTEAEIRGALVDANILDPNLNVAQLAVNIKDYVDADSEVSILDNSYGFERPCIYISEVVRAVKARTPGDPVRKDYRSFAIELYKPYVEDDDPVPTEWSLFIDNSAAGVNDVSIPLNWTGSANFHVFTWIDNDGCDIPVNFIDKVDANYPSPKDGATRVNPEIDFSWPELSDADGYKIYLGTDFNAVRDSNCDSPDMVFCGDSTGTNSFDPGTLDMGRPYHWRIDYMKDGDVILTGDVMSFTTYAAVPEANSSVITRDDEPIFEAGSIIKLMRNGIPVDLVIVDPNMISSEGTFRMQRDINQHKCIRRLWKSDNTIPTVGSDNEFDGGGEKIQAHPPNKGFTNIGEIGMVFKGNVYDVNVTISSESQVRLNLADPYYQQIFNYLTVMDPATKGLDPKETRIKGRININTAPWYVIAQLPWVNERPDEKLGGELARAIVAYRDKLDLSVEGGPDYSQDRGVGMDSGDPCLVREEPGFAGIGELVNVINDVNEYYDMRWFTLGDHNGVDLKGFPDLTPGGSCDCQGDGAEDDFEERDVIFARISNLVTVRSDIFTAYLLVRLGRDGPQKRVIAILDRSSGSDVKVLARYEVPDPR